MVPIAWIVQAFLLLVALSVFAVLGRLYDSAVYNIKGHVGNLTQFYTGEQLKCLLRIVAISFHDQCALIPLCVSVFLSKVRAPAVD